MKIGQSPPAAAFRPPQNRDAAATPATAPRRSFLDALQAERRGGSHSADIRAPIEPVVGTQEQHFAVATHIGDDAVRFDARPIVAPSGETLGETNAAGSPNAGVRDAADAQALLPGAVPDPTSQRDLGPRLVERVVQLMAKVAADATGASSPNQPAHAAHMASGGVALDKSGAIPIRFTAESPNSPADPSRAATPPPRGSAADAAATVRLIALPRDIVLAVRGISLTAADIRTLREALRETLQRQGLGDRMVRIENLGRR